jgi:hypothetical protein
LPPALSTLAIIASLLCRRNRLPQSANHCELYVMRLGDDIIRPKRRFKLEPD